MKRPYPRSPTRREHGRRNCEHTAVVCLLLPATYRSMEERMNRNKTIDYIEFRANNLPAIKQFYTQVFGWEFEDLPWDRSRRAQDRSSSSTSTIFPRRKNRSKRPAGKSPRTSSPFPGDRASILPIPMETNWPHGQKVDVGYTPTGKGFGEDSSALAPIRKRSNLPSSRDIRPVYQ